MKKYLDLAVAMEKNRGDWSDGYSYVESALEVFSVENELDKEIYDELYEIVYTSAYDCVDGRHFRDCKHNYNWIYENLLTDEERKQYEKEVMVW